MDRYLTARTIIAILVLPALGIVALWFPFGFSLGGLIEEWDILFLFAQHGVFFVADATSPLPLHQARPLTILPQAIAYTLDPNSFLYWHVIQAASLLIKGVTTGIIGIYLTGNRAQAALLSLLAMFYPADTMQLSFRSIHINSAIALALIGTVLLILAIHTSSRTSRITAAITASGFFTCALLMYEVVIGLAALPFLIPIARFGRDVSGLFRRSADAVVIWVSIIGLWLVFFLWTIRTASGYQAAAISNSNFYAIASRLTSLATSGLYRAFYDCWAELFGPIVGSLSDYSYFVFVIAVLAVVLVWLAHEGKPASMQGLECKTLGPRIIILGLCTFLLGYAPFLSTESHLFLTQRVFLVPAIGAALVLLGCIVVIAPVFPRSFVGTISALLIGGCFLSQLYQFDRYNRIYATITRPILSAVVPFVSESANHKYSVLFNDYGFLSGAWDLGLELQVALGYLIPGIRAGYIFVCESASGRLLPRGSGPVAQRGFCLRVEHDVALAEPGHTAVMLKDAAVGTLDRDGTVSFDGSEGAVTKRLPERASQVFSLSTWTPIDSMFRARERPDHFECRFKSMWGYAVPCRAFGFYDAVPYSKNFDSSYAWIGETRSGLIFDIQPHQKDYQVVIDTLDCVSPLRQLKMKLNGSDLIATSDGQGRMEATFQGSLLKGRNNVIEFDTELNDQLGLSYAVKAVLVRPLNASGQ